MQSNYAIFQKQPNTVGSFLQEGIGGLFNPRVTTDINDAAAVLQSNFTDLNSLAPIILDNPTDVFGNIIAENQMLTQQEGPRIFLPTHGDPLPPQTIAPIDPEPSILFDPPITSDPFQPERIPDDQLTPEQFASLYGTAAMGAERIPDDQLTNEQYMALYGDVATEDQGFIEDEFAPKEFPIEDPVAVEVPMATATPIGQPIDTATTTDTGTNPFYAGATNVAQPPSMTPIAPSFGLDVGVGSYGTTADLSAALQTPFGGFTPTITSSTPGNAMYDYYTQPQTTAAPATDVAPQTTTTPLPTVNSFAGFSGFGGFGGF